MPASTVNGSDGSTIAVMDLHVTLPTRVPPVDRPGQLQHRILGKLGGRGRGHVCSVANTRLAFSGADFRDRFHRWLYASAVAASTAPSARVWLHEVDLTPPVEVRRRHGVVPPPDPSRP